MNIATMVIATGIACQADENRVRQAQGALEHGLCAIIGSTTNGETLVILHANQTT